MVRRNEQLVEAKTSYFTNRDGFIPIDLEYEEEQWRNNPTCKRNMANYFSAFFYNKIVNIRSELGLLGGYKCGSMRNYFPGTLLTTFMGAIELEIRNIINCHLLSHANWTRYVPGF